MDKRLRGKGFRAHYDNTVDLRKSGLVTCKMRYHSILDACSTLT